MGEKVFNREQFIKKCDDRTYQATLPPRERTNTMPAGIPKYTLGYSALAWIENNLKVPDGKNAGTPFECTFDQALFILWFYAVDDKGEFIYRRGIRRLGKGPITHDTPIVTPDGVRAHGDLRVDDKVYAVDGSITEVVELGQVVHEDCYRVFFRGGGSVDCTGSHRFPVMEYVNSSRRVEKIVTVAEMLDKGLIIGGNSRYKSLPVPKIENCTHQHDYNDGFIVERIEPIASKPARCITVAHPSHQYLVGERLIPTCNSGKSPFAAALALFELLGECRFSHFDKNVAGGVVGKPDPLPLVQLAATSETQTGVTMRTIIGMANKRTALARKYELDVGRTYIYTPNGGRLQLLTSSATSAEGWAATFIIADELEHWTSQNGGKNMYDTMRRNLAKTGARMVETCNAWIPSEDCVAEQSFDDWCDQQEGKAPLNVDGANTAILYDARIAPANTALTDEPEKGEISLSDGLNFVYKYCPWAAVGAIKGEIWTPSTPVSSSRRFYLNQPNSASGAWINLADWAALADPDRALVDGEDVVLFFDGSKSNDHTALVGCCISDGFVFTVGVWAPEKVTGEVSAVKVDNAVRDTFRRFNVVAFWADVREWESFVKSSWVEEHGDNLVVPAVASGKAQALIAWDMRTHQYEFAMASEQVRAEIQDGKFKHDGNWDTSRHMGNCREAERRGFITVRKESPKSPNKIDAAVCVIGARMVYRRVLASAEWENYSGSANSWGALGW